MYIRITFNYFTLSSNTIAMIVAGTGSAAIPIIVIISFVRKKIKNRNINTLKS